MEYIKSNRVGKFEISIVVINCNPEGVCAVMAECIVIDVDLQHYNGKAVYTAISDRFDEVSRGKLIPMYLWELERIDEGTKTRVVDCRRICD